MVEVYGNLWEYPADWRVISTNGTVKKNGECVMGRGCAAEAKKKYPGLAMDLGTRIEFYGNVPLIFEQEKLVTFPVKHKWYEKADPKLIEKSTAALTRFALLHSDEVIALPRPGCGNGQLKWEDVKPLLVGLPDNVKVITFPPTL